MVRVSPGSPSKWMATRSPWPASTCRSTQLYGDVELAADEPLRERRVVPVERLRSKAVRPGQRRAGLLGPEAPRGRRRPRSYSVGRAVGLRGELGAAAGSVRSSWQQVRQGLVRHSVLQFGQQHVRAHSTRSGPRLQGEPPGSRPAAVRPGRRSHARGPGRAGRDAHSGSDPVARPHPHVRRAEPGGVGGQVVGLVLRLPLGRDPRAVVLDLAGDACWSQPRTGATSSATSGAAACAAVPGLDRDPGPAGQDVVQVQRALVRGGVARLDLQVAPGAPASGSAELRVARRPGRAARGSASRSGRAGARSGDAQPGPGGQVSGRAFHSAVVAVGADQRDLVGARLRAPCRSSPCTAASTASLAITR